MHLLIFLHIFHNLVYYLLVIEPLTPALFAPSTFESPPITCTLPFKSISPVSATVLLIGVLVNLKYS